MEKFIIKKGIVFLVAIFSAFFCCAQDMPKNLLSTSLIRIESGPHNIYPGFTVKIFKDIEYQRFVNRWRLGVRYEHGINKKTENPGALADDIVGVAYRREDNLYLMANYTLLKLMDSRLMLYSGLGMYYSNSKYFGNFFQFGRGYFLIDRRYNTLGLAPRLGLDYFPSNRFYLSLNSSMRIGRGTGYDAIEEKNIDDGQFSITVPELRVGILF